MLRRGVCSRAWNGESRLRGDSRGQSRVRRGVGIDGISRDVSG
jgi:hypothetical protein